MGRQRSASPATSETQNKAEDPALSTDAFKDFANEANAEIGNYRVQMMLSPDKMRFNTYCVPKLDWQSIRYGNAELNQVPNDRRGVYAFVLCEQSPVLPPHGYVLYVGIAGRGSTRSLRARYKEYLNAKAVTKKRPRIAYMIGNWQPVLRFYFVPVEPDFPSEDLELLESQLNTALMPPFSEGDLEAETKKKRRAFK
jgi:hypothetical protein